MNQIRVLTLFIVLLAVAKGDNGGVKSFEDYVHLNRLQHAKVLNDYNTKIKQLRERYTKLIEVNEVQINMVSASIAMMEQRLQPFLVLSDLSKYCITRYSLPIPSVKEIQFNMTRCFSEVSQEFDISLNKAVSTRRTLKKYYKDVFEKGIEACKHEFESNNTNYKVCITDLVHVTNSYAANNKVIFGYELDAAECIAKARSKGALDCSYNMQHQIISKIAQTTFLVNKCLQYEDNCEPCEATCLNEAHIKADYENKFIANPFYGNKYQEGCVVLTAL